MATFGLPVNGAQVLRYTDKLIEEHKADNRGVVIDAIRAVLVTSQEQWRITEDPRFLEMILRATDRLTRLLKLEAPQAQAVPEAVGTQELVSRVRADLLALEGRMEQP